MYSCVNQPRGCRGRVNIPGGRCDSCRQLNLRKPSVFSAGPTAYRRPSIDFSSFDIPTQDPR
ncbi:hypothetical protein FN846DRAFT_699468 [Sphaerosporella brunnea]|uniref:Uncharacterized protein n=1 Tax=Sphaerosporella brunnea TaxID=1250544 RepID=A0A5J5EXX8_9PEZI|nr:hypothetical protein FN846DRAFT_699468 [Sphaerosporella brunnea]